MNLNTIYELIFKNSRKICHSACLGLMFIVPLTDLYAGSAVKIAGESSVFRKVQSPALRLESLIVEVNGERRRIDPKEGFTVVKGDLVAIVDAWLVDKNKKAPKVKVASLKRLNNKLTDDDRGRVFDTNTDLEYKPGVKELESKIAIRVLGAGVLHGETTLNVVNPKLFSFEVEVNGQRKKLMDGESLSLGPKDGIKVVELHTNVRGNENIKHELFTSRGSNGVERKELRFTRGNAVFARIPIEWQGL